MAGEFVLVFSFIVFVDGGTLEVEYESHCALHSIS